MIHCRYGKKSDFQPQKHNLGCGIACTAYAAGVSYDDGLHAFKNTSQAIMRGVFCREIVSALANLGYHYKHLYNKCNIIQYKDLPNGSIAYMPKTQKYPFGHFIYKEQNIWVDPWRNYHVGAKISNARAGYRYRMSGQPQYIIIPVNRVSEIQDLMRRNRA